MSVYNRKEIFPNGLLTGNMANAGTTLQRNGKSIQCLQEGWRAKPSRCPVTLERPLNLIGMKSWGLIIKGTHCKLSGLQSWRNGTNICFWSSFCCRIPPVGIIWMGSNFVVFTDPFLPGSDKTNLSCGSNGLCSESVVYMARVLCILLLTYSLSPGKWNGLSLWQDFPRFKFTGQGHSFLKGYEQISCGQS